MRLREAGNMALHIGVGGALALAVCWSLWMLILGTFIYAFLREQAQHRYELWLYFSGTDIYKVKKYSFFDFGWITWHRIWEVLQWTLGAAAAVGAWKLFT